jgi:hypothetical protein
MIVKDEAELLPACLRAVHGLWDELCVVDTGSSDDSVAMITAAGGRAIHRPWDGDFSAARNAGLEQATGDWILFLDADEMVSPELAAQIKALLDDRAAGAATVVMRNLLPHGHRRDTAMLRLFRRHPAVRFTHPIHEDVTAAVARQLALDGRRLRHLPGVVEHLGYVRARATARHKKARDMDLLTRCLERDPGDVYSWFKLLELARFWDDRPLWSEAAAAARGAIDRAGPLALAGRPFGGELIALCADGLHPGDARGALVFTAQWIDLIDPSAPLRLRRGELRELTGDAPGAASDFQACLALADRTPDRQLATVRPLMGLARLALAAGDVAAADGRAREALRFGPRDPEALLLVALLARARGGEAGARALAAALRAEQGDSVELHEALGEAALLGGQPGQAVTELSLAAGDPPAGRAACRLAQALLAAGELEASHRLSTALSAALPEAALGVLVCDLLAGRDSDLVLEVEEEVAARALRSWVDVLRGAGPPVMLERFRRALPAIAPFFPWLPVYVARSPDPIR